MVDDFQPRNRAAKNKDDNQQFPGAKPDDTPTQTTSSEPMSKIDLKSSGVKAPEQKGIKHKFMSLGMKLWPETKKQKIIGACIIVVLIIGGVVIANALNKTKLDVGTSNIVKKEKITSKLTGVEVKKEINDRAVISVQIENSLSARPQSGLSKAGFVYEAIAEGGITRYNVSFLENAPKNLGPVRSVRPYYADLAAPFDPVFVNAGGSGQGLAEIKSLKLMNINALAPGGPFHRISSRPAPHNLYSSVPALRDYAKKRGDKNSDTKSFARKNAQPAKKPTVTRINVNISSPLYNSSYVYDKKSNSYKRSLGGVKHTDQNTGKQIAPKVVVVLVMKYSQNGIYSVYRTTGKGTAFIFQDGKLYKATWQRSGKKDIFKFTDSKGKEVKLNAGQTWVTLAGDKNMVKYR